MIVCKHCLEAILSHGDSEAHRNAEWQDIKEELITEDDLVICEFCGDPDDISEMEVI